jgi:hypothetical protein
MGGVFWLDGFFVDPTTCGSTQCSAGLNSSMAFRASQSGLDHYNVRFNQGTLDARSE